MAARKTPADQLAELRRIARSRGGEVLSTAYKGDLPKLFFRCAEDHVWLVSPGKIKQGRWCPECGRARTADARRKLGRVQVVEIVKRRGGTILSEYVTSQTKQKYRCAEGHVWQAVPESIIQGTWCPKCANPIRHAWRKERVFRRMQLIARAQGGKLLSKSFEHSDVPLLFRCARGHEWRAGATSIAEGTWCRACKEENWLEVVRARAKEQGGKCLSPRCRGWADRLLFECALGHRWKAEALQVKQGRWCPLCRRAPRLDIEQMRSLARERGGECLSERYVGHETNLRWRCAEGHVWSARPASVIQGSWCRICRRGQGRPRRFLGIEVMREMARERGGECLSEEYYGIGDRLRWRCARGHEWVTVANNVRRGGWCPTCSHGTLGSLGRMRALAHERGGRCLSRSWNDHSQPLLFECSRGHRFKAKAGPIKSGVWCPICKALQPGLVSPAGKRRPRRRRLAATSGTPKRSGPRSRPRRSGSW
jgi:hypothetical protein